MKPEKRARIARLLSRTFLDGNRRLWSLLEKYSFARSVEQHVVRKKTTFKLVRWLSQRTHRLLRGDAAPLVAIDLDELSRYVRALQRQILTEGTDEWFSHERHKAWALANRSKLGQLAPEAGRDQAVDEYVRELERFEPTSPHDSASAAAIFQPLMEEVIEAAGRLGLGTSRRVTLECAPSIETTPFTRSSDGVHIILVGPATSAFCNYWAKILISLISGQRVHRKGSSVPTRVTLEAVRDATRLSIYYALTGTVLGFGVLASDSRLLAPRMEYVTAMEVFVLAHEYGHCLAEDGSERYRGILEEGINRELELLCDRIGTAIGKEFGADASWAAFCGAGAILMIYSSSLCEQARRILKGNEHRNSHTHPPASERLAVVREQVLSTTPRDQVIAVTSYLDDITALCAELASVVVEIIEDVARAEDDGLTRSPP